MKLLSIVVLVLLGNLALANDIVNCEYSYFGVTDATPNKITRFEAVPVAVTLDKNSAFDASKFGTFSLPTSLAYVLVFKSGTELKFEVKSENFNETPFTAIKAKGENTVELEFVGPGMSETTKIQDLSISCK